LCQSASRAKLILGLSSTSKVEDLWTTRLGTAYCNASRFHPSLWRWAPCRTHPIWLRHLVRITHGGLTTGSLRSNKQRGRDKAEQAATLFTLHLALCQTSHLIQRSSLRFYPEEKASKKGKRRRPGSTSICARGFLLRPFRRQVRRLYARTIGTERRRVTLCSCS
jgi:hypothetical protein